MTTEYGFKTINASRTVQRVSADLRRGIKAIIDEAHLPIEEREAPLDATEPDVARIAKRRREAKLSAATAKKIQIDENGVAPSKELIPNSGA